MDKRGVIAGLIGAGLLVSACAPRDSKSDAAAASTPPAATVEEPAKPAAPAAPFTFEQKTPDATVGLEIDKALGAWPVLHKRLYDEEVPKLKSFAADAKADRDGMKGEDFLPPPYEEEIAYAPTASSARLLSVLRTWYDSQGGAHPNHGSSGLLWDATGKRVMKAEELFVKGADDPIDKALCDAITAEKKDRGADEGWDPATNCPAWRDSHFVLEPSTEAGKFGGLTFLFDPYDIGAYAEGDYEITLPWTVFKAVLAPQWAGEFAGAPKPKPRPRDE